MYCIVFSNPFFSSCRFVLFEDTEWCQYLGWEFYNRFPRYIQDSWHSMPHDHYHLCLMLMFSTVSYLWIQSHTSYILCSKWSTKIAILPITPQVSVTFTAVPESLSCIRSLQLNRPLLDVATKRHSIQPLPQLLLSLKS